MRKVIIFIVFLIIIFIINLIFYFLSEEYRIFLKKIKNTESIITIEKEEDYSDIDNKIESIEKVELSNKNEKFFKQKNDSGKVALKKEIILGKNYKEILNMFSNYNLIELELNSGLFDLTDEYPDNYFEYYSKDLTLYLFPTKNYTDLYNIFSILDDELPFSLNEVNNFGDNSFFINLNDDIKDNFVRLVISNKGITFGLKIRKKEYNLVKEKLKTLKK